MNVYNIELFITPNYKRPSPLGKCPLNETSYNYFGIKNYFFVNYELI